MSEVGIVSYPSLSRAVQGFILTKTASGLSHYTIRNYQTDLLRFTEWAKDPPIDAVTSRQMEAYFKYLREEFRITKRGANEIPPRKLSTKSIQNAWGALSSFWNWASQEFEIPNPLARWPV